ncbi:hypothetical protein F5Y03DRAFT_82885 [Xylaria venustula]|nr:hypothetical protein F5Y03DRAFT_82885 [Xylaria venustula]
MASMVTKRLNRPLGTDTVFGSALVRHACLSFAGCYGASLEHSVDWLRIPPVSNIKEQLSVSMFRPLPARQPADRLGTASIVTIIRSVALHASQIERSILGYGSFYWDREVETVLKQPRLASLAPVAHYPVYYTTLYVTLVVLINANTLCIPPLYHAGYRMHAGCLMTPATNRLG